MTTIIILLYLASIADGITTFAGFIGFISLIVWFIASIVLTDNDFTGNSVSELKKLRNIMMLLACLALPISLLMPTSQFFYQVAAIKTGELTVEQINKSERAQKVLESLDRWLEVQTPETQPLETIPTPGK